MRTIIAAAMLAGALFTAPAFAQDAPAPDKEFQGFKILAVGGLDRVNSFGEGATGFGYGGTVGYDYQSGRGVFGVEGEIDGSTAKKCYDNVITAGDRSCGKTGRDLYAGVRAGYAVSPKTMLYLKGGYTNARVGGTYSVGTTSSTSYENLDGWRVGAGAEANVGRNVVARVEYRYSNYESDTSRQQGVVGIGFKF